MQTKETLKNSIPENILIKRCLKGDTKAEYELFCLFAKPMVNVTFRILGNGFDAEDVVQESFLKAFKKLNSFNGNSTFGAWIKRIVINESLGFLRKQKFVFEILNDNHFEKEEEVDIDPCKNMEVVMQAINELPEGARVVFCLKAIENYKLIEVSEMLNLSTSNVKVQYHRAKKLLKGKLVHKVYME